MELKTRSLSFNLEPTFRCNLGCEMCPRFSSEDPHLDMSPGVYQRIWEAMDYAHTVDFTGWGEPLLHPRIYDMVAMARDKGCLPTMTTNGTALTERNIQSLIDAGMLRLTVSVDGMTPQTFNQIRIGADFEKVTKSLCRLSSMVAAQSSSLELGIAFTIQETNAAELELIVPWAEKVGARVLHLKQLNVVSNRQDWDRSFLKYVLHGTGMDARVLGALEDRMLAVREAASARGIRTLTHSQLPMDARMEGRHCLATPLHSVYFSYEGKTAPCCHFGHHVSRFFEGEDYGPSSLFFGDIKTQPFEDIWQSPDFVAFRRGFEMADFPAPCRTCYLLYGK